MAVTGDPDTGDVAGVPWFIRGEENLRRSADGATSPPPEAGFIPSWHLLDRLPSFLENELRTWWRDDAPIRSAEDLPDLHPLSQDPDGQRALLGLGSVTADRIVVLVGDGGLTQDTDLLDRALELYADVAAADPASSVAVVIATGYGRLRPDGSALNGLLTSLAAHSAHWTGRAPEIHLVGERAGAVTVAAATAQLPDEVQTITYVDPRTSDEFDQPTAHSGGFDNVFVTYRPQGPTAHSVGTGADELDFAGAATLVAPADLPGIITGTGRPATLPAELADFLTDADTDGPATADSDAATIDADPEPSELTESSSVLRAPGAPGPQASPLSLEAVALAIAADRHIPILLRETVDAFEGRRGEQIADLVKESWVPGRTGPRSMEVDSPDKLARLLGMWLLEGRARRSQHMEELSAALERTDGSFDVAAREVSEQNADLVRRFLEYRRDETMSVEEVCERLAESTRGTALELTAKGVRKRVYSSASKMAAAWPGKPGLAAVGMVGAKIQAYDPMLVEDWLAGIAPRELRFCADQLVLQGRSPAEVAAVPEVGYGEAELAILRMTLLRELIESLPEGTQISHHPKQLTEKEQAARRREQLEARALRKLVKQLPARLQGVARLRFLVHASADRTAAVLAISVEEVLEREQSAADTIRAAREGQPDPQEAAESAAALSPGQSDSALVASALASSPKRLRRVIDELSAAGGLTEKEQRYLALITRWEGVPLTYSQIAAKLGITPTAVSSLRRRALHKVAEELRVREWSTSAPADSSSWRGAVEPYLGDEAPLGGQEILRRMRRGGPRHQNSPPWRPMRGGTHSAGSFPSAPEELPDDSENGVWCPNGYLHDEARAVGKLLLAKGFQQLQELVDTVLFRTITDGWFGNETPRVKVSSDGPMLVVTVEGCQPHFVLTAHGPADTREIRVITTVALSDSIEASATIDDLHVTANIADDIAKYIARARRPDSTTGDAESGRLAKQQIEGIQQLSPGRPGYVELEGATS